MGEWECEYDGVRMHSKQHNIIRLITTPTTKQDPRKRISNVEFALRGVVEIEVWE